MIQLLLNKTMPHFQLLPISKVDTSSLRIHEVPPLQYPKSHIIPHHLTEVYHVIQKVSTGHFLYVFICFYVFMFNGKTTIHIDHYKPHQQEKNSLDLIFHAFRPDFFFS